MNLNAGVEGWYMLLTGQYASKTHVWIESHSVGLSDLELLKELRSERNLVRCKLVAKSVNLKAERFL